jgi:hypothetical protein
LIQDVHGLSQVNKQLLEQRGAIGVPSVRLREMAKKVATMLPIVRPTYAAIVRPTYPMPEPFPVGSYDWSLLPEPITSGMIARPPPPPRADPYLPFGGYPAMINVRPPTQQEGPAALGGPGQRPYDTGYPPMIDYGPYVPKTQYVSQAAPGGPVPYPPNR